MSESAIPPVTQPIEFAWRMAHRGMESSDEDVSSEALLLVGETLRRVKNTRRLNRSRAASVNLLKTYLPAMQAYRQGELDKDFIRDWQPSLGRLLGSWVSFAHQESVLDWAVFNGIALGSTALLGLPEYFAFPQKGSTDSAGPELFLPNGHGDRINLQWTKGHDAHSTHTIRLTNRQRFAATDDRKGALFLAESMSSALQHKKVSSAGRFMVRVTTQFMRRRLDAIAGRDDFQPQPKEDIPPVPADYAALRKKFPKAHFPLALAEHITPETLERPGEYRELVDYLNISREIETAMASGDVRRFKDVIAFLNQSLVGGRWSENPHFLFKATIINALSPAFLARARGVPVAEYTEKVHWKLQHACRGTLFRQRCTLDNTGFSTEAMFFLLFAEKATENPEHLLYLSLAREEKNFPALSGGIRTNHDGYLIKNGAKSPVEIKAVEDETVYHPAIRKVVGRNVLPHTLDSPNVATRRMLNILTADIASRTPEQQALIDTLWENTRTELGLE